MFVLKWNPTSICSIIFIDTLFTPYSCVLMSHHNITSQKTLWVYSWLLGRKQLFAPLLTSHSEYFLSSQYHPPQFGGLVLSLKTNSKSSEKRYRKQTKEGSKFFNHNFFRGKLAVSFREGIQSLSLFLLSSLSSKTKTILQTRRLDLHPQQPTGCRRFSPRRWCFQVPWRSSNEAPKLITGSFW